MATTTPTPTYNVNYDDERFAKVESDKGEALTELEQTYGGMIGESDKFYQAQIDASKQWADTQSQLQQDRTDFAIEQIEQQKGQAQKDYLKEQSGAYVDWQKQSDQYGANAEKMASSGLTGTGFSESSQVSMYNAYQNRVATARESFNMANLNYDNAIKDARIQNNSVLAEIAYQAYQQQLELSLEGFQYKNQLILDQANKKLEVENIYYQRYQDVLNQINTENALAQEDRHFYDNMAFQEEQSKLDRDFTAQQNVLDRQHDEKLQSIEQNWKAAQAKLDREHEINVLNAKTKAEKDLIEKEYAEKTKYLAEETKKQKEILDKELANQKALIDHQASQKTANIGGGGGGGSGGGGGTGGSGIIPGVSAGGQAAVNTPYYRGNLNSDAKKYGTFSNGYQPKGISGHGKLKKTGDTITVNTQIMYGSSKGKSQALEQSIWKAEDGTLWYWEGRENKYKPFKASGGGGGSFSPTGNLQQDLSSFNDLLKPKRQYQ